MNIAHPKPVAAFGALTCDYAVKDLGDDFSSTCYRHARAIEEEVAVCERYVACAHGAVHA